jgi:hypothetical protein
MGAVAPVDYGFSNMGGGLGFQAPSQAANSGFNFAGSAPTGMWDSLLNWGKNNMGTSSNPGLIPMGYGALSNAYNLFQGGQRLKQDKAAFNFNKDMQLRGFNAGVDQYNNALEDKAAYRFSNLEGKRTGSAENNAYVEKYVKEKGLKNV